MARTQLLSWDEARTRILAGATALDLGSAKQVVVTKDDATLIEGAGEKAEIEGRCNERPAPPELV